MKIVGVVIAASSALVRDVIDQPAGMLAHLPAPEGGRVRQAVTGKVHGEQPDWLIAAAMTSLVGGVINTWLFLVRVTE